MKRMFLMGAVLGVAVAGAIGLSLGARLPPPPPAAQAPQPLLLERPGERLDVRKRQEGLRPRLAGQPLPPPSP